MSIAHPTPWALVGQAIRDANDGVVVSAINPCGMETRKMIVAAVNAASERKPRRNCDVGTPEEQTRRMNNEYCSRQKECYESPSGKSCPLLKTGVDCRLIWAQMPYEKGGAVGTPRPTDND